jgi:O-glycosyl hydrolase
VTPTNGSTGVAVLLSITAKFSEPINSLTITTSTFTLTSSDGSGVAAVVGFITATNTATLAPVAALANNTTYTATLTTGVASTSGAPLAAAYSWTFTTAAGPAPTVSSVTPVDQSTGVAITSPVTATFSEAMNSSTITGSTFTLTPQGGSAVAATVSYAAGVATLTPTAQLANNTTYTATITTGVTSSAGSALAANYIWTFTTATAPPPAVASVTPLNLSTTAAISTTVTATFNQAMNSSTITASTFTLTGPGNSSVQGTVAYNAGTSVATFTPAANLAYSTTYVATLSTSITSSAGTALAANYTWSFTTTTPPVPTVTTTVPIDGATGVNISNALTATFSQPMNSSTITPTTFTLTGPGNTAVAGLITYNTGTSTATFTPNAALAYSTSYTGTITTGATSAAGATLASNYMWTFMTGASPNQVTVDFGKTYQTIRGFGGSTAWLGQLTTAQATALFNQSSGLGLSILRVRIDPEGASSSNWVTGEWTAELANAQEAMVANSNAIVIASPWTPPISMKNNSTSQPYINPCSPAANYCGGYLDPSHYADYVNYLEDFVTYFKNNGVNLYAISMQNEPDWNPPANPNSYEACLWTPAQMDTWVALLTSGGATYPFGTTKLIMPESLNFNPAQSNPTLADSSAAANVSIIAGHLYGASPSYATNAEAANKEVWMTEHATCESNCPAPSIADALASAEEVHNSMTVGYYNAYVWWWIWNDLNASPTLNYGLINSSTTSPAPTYYGAGVGQFSKFIQPGYVRVSATANPVSGVYVSAYSNSSPSHYVIVAINANTSTESLTFVLNNGTVTSVTPYETTSTAMITAQTAVSVSSGQFSYTLPAQSIVTFVQ